MESATTNESVLNDEPSFLLLNENFKKLFSVTSEQEGCWLESQLGHFCVATGVSQKLFILLSKTTRSD